MPTTVNVIETGVGDAYVDVEAWVAVIVTTPGLYNVAIAPSVATILKSEDVKFQTPVDVEVGG